MEQRKETDFIGSVKLPTNALYGIHSVRAKENFPDTTPFHREWYMALGVVKKACYLTAAGFYENCAPSTQNVSLPFG